LNTPRSSKDLKEST